MKGAAFYAYDRHDSQLPCYTQALRTSGPKASECATYAVWLQRSYRISFTPSWNQPCLVPGVGGELLLDAEEIIRAAGCSVADVRDSNDQVLSPTEVENNLGTLVDFTTPTTEPKFLPQGTPVSIELEPPESPNGPGPAHGASRPQRRATPTPSRTQAGLRTRDVRYRSSTTSYS